MAAEKGTNTDKFVANRYKAVHRQINRRAVVVRF